ncbi:MAG: hypothetical protein AB7E36_00895 [Salinivirgaceae bacterium]
MKTVTKKIGLAVLVLLGMFLVTTSCNKEETLDTPALTANVDGELYTAEVFDEIAEIGDEALDLAETGETNLKTGVVFGYSRLSECVTVTKVITDTLITTTIDFGEVNCLCNDGRERRGKIIMTHEGHYWDGTVYIDFAFDNFFVDDNQIVGEKQVMQTINNDGNRESVISINGSLILADGSGTISIVAERVRTIVVGSDTKTKRDDIIETTGNSTVTLADGTVVTTDILSPLVRKHEMNCFMYIVQGVLQIVHGEESPITIDYGNGECDNLATVTQDGVSVVVELQRKCNKSI